MNAPQQPGVQATAGDKYADMLALAELFDRSGEELRARAQLGPEILTDPGVAESAPLGATTWTEAEDQVRHATTGRRGLLTRSVELDADALVVRATVLTYRWIDELADAAYRTLGSIAGRAVGYLAPEVALGGAIVQAGLIETDTLDREGVATYLNELAENNPEFLEHISSGGGLLDGLQMRSLLTAGVLASDAGPMAARGGLRAIGAVPLGTDTRSALRDAAGTLVPAEETADPVAARGPERPASLADLVGGALGAGPVATTQVAPHRYVVWLGGPSRPGSGPLRLVGGDVTRYLRQVRASLDELVSTDPEARVMLVGTGQGGTVAAEIAASPGGRPPVDQVVTAGSPAALAPRIPEETRVLSLEDRSDPVALLGSLMSADVTNRVTVVFHTDGFGPEAYLAGAAEADASGHPGLVAELDRLRELDYLA